MNTVPHRRLTPEELHASMMATLAGWNGRSALWLFAYGSLMWKPEFDYDRRVPARVFGYHRKLCLRSVRYRGTEQQPGIVAGLDRGGSCAGVAYRMPAQAVQTQFARLWEREMFMGSYAARWLHVRLLTQARARVSTSARTVRALAFVVRRDGPNYCERLSDQEMLGVLLNARGIYGTSLEYLQHTVAALRADGMCDPHLERLASFAEARRGGRGLP